MPSKQTLKYLIILTFLIPIGALFFKESLGKSKYKIGDKVDSFNGVAVYYNGDIDHVEGRNRSKDGYNIGLKYQCVEFVKRYYLEALNHKMPESYGHAKSFFNAKVKDGKLNKARGLLQFTNPSSEKPKKNDLIVFDGHIFNKFGHVAIVSKVRKDSIEIVQQNPGPSGKSREVLSLVKTDEQWKVKGYNILGWLRLKSPITEDGARTNN